MLPNLPCSNTHKDVQQAPNRTKQESRRLPAGLTDMFVPVAWHHTAILKGRWDNLRTQQHQPYCSCKSASQHSMLSIYQPAISVADKRPTTCPSASGISRKAACRREQVNAEQTCKCILHRCNSGAPLLKDAMYHGGLVKRWRARVNERQLLTSAFKLSDLLG